MDKFTMNCPSVVADHYVTTNLASGVTTVRTITHAGLTSITNVSILWD